MILGTGIGLSMQVLILVVQNTVDFSDLGVATSGVTFFRTIGSSFGAAIFGLASFTDWLDGYLARRRHQVTALGQFIDPFADKLLTISALISLVQMDLAPAWMVAIIVGREFAVTVLRSLAHARGATMAASPLGKIKMIAQVVAILALILGKDHLQGFFIIGQVALWVVVIAALVSAADYFRRFGSFLYPRAQDPVPSDGALPKRKVS